MGHSKRCKLFQTTLNAISAFTLAVMASACDTQPGYHSPEGVLLLARNAVVTDDFNAFAETLTGRAYAEHGDAFTARPTSGNRYAFERLRHIWLSRPDLVVMPPALQNPTQLSSIQRVDSFEYRAVIHDSRIHRDLVIITITCLNARPGSSQDRDIPGRPCRISDLKI